jgi:FkbM family methyltransferase
MDFFTVSVRGAPVYFPDLPHDLLNVVRRTGRFYEQELLSHIENTVPRDGIWIDVGANVGNHSLFFARLATRIISIEPHPETFGTLTSTIHRNGITNATLVNAAAGRDIGTLRLGLPEGISDPGQFRADAQQHAVVVAVKPLDEIVGDHGPARVRLIKVDVEGAEADVILGAMATIRRDRPHLVVEARSEMDLLRIRELVGAGYRLVGRYCATPTYHLAPWSAIRFVGFRLKRKLRHVLAHETALA